MSSVRFMTYKEIAVKFDVQPRTVKMWSARHDDFPSAVDPGDSAFHEPKQFLRSDIEAWGKATGRLDRYCRPTYTYKRRDNR